MSPGANITGVRPIVGMEIHVELGTRTKMFTRVPNPAHAEAPEAAPNSLIDPLVLALPGSLPVMNKAAVEMSIRVGLALGCQIAALSRWDRKGYYYPDLPKAYQISQYQLPLCFDGAVDLPASDAQGFPDLSRPGRRIGILRAHLEEDAGKLLHEAPGGRAIDFSIVDYNRAGTPLLEIVTQPDFAGADECVLFARLLRATCRALNVTAGVMQKGHMRFEPNIICELTLEGGRVVRTPIVEIKNLNSFRALKAAIEFELREQPGRWREDGLESAPGAKTTRGWDDARGATFLQREKEDAHDYRYFPDPDLLPVAVDEAWRDRLGAGLPEAPLSRFRRYAGEYALPAKEAFSLCEERTNCDYLDAAVDALVELGVDRSRAGKAAGNILLQAAARRANERGVLASALGLPPTRLAALARLREDGSLPAAGVESIFDELCTPGGEVAPRDALAHVESVAQRRGVLIVRDQGAMNAWIAQVLAANPGAVEDVRAGRLQAAGRLVGEVMKLSGGQADAKSVREAILKDLGAG